MCYSPSTRVCVEQACSVFLFQAEDGIRYLVRSRGLGDVYKRQVRRMILDSLHYWVEEMHVDGFRFDLATVMGRRPDGFDPEAPLLAAIARDPILSPRIMIAEPWDVGPGGYSVFRNRR